MQDFRLAFRSLAATPVMTAVATLSLALGIGANTAIFSLANALLFRALPVRQPRQLFLLTTTQPDKPQYSYATFAHIRDQVDALDGALGYTDCCGKSIVERGGHNEMVDRQFVTGGFFDTLGVGAYRGRLLTPPDDTATPPFGPVVVVSYRYWRDRLGASDAAVGGPLTIDATRVTIVGVTPPGFFGVEVGRSFDILAPLHLAPRLTSTPFDDDTVWLNIMVRPRAAVDVPAAEAALRAAQPRIREAAMPKRFGSPKFLQDPFVLSPATTGVSTLRDQFERPLLALFVLVALVLLIACANVASLLLGRGNARRRELSVRVALGASRWRLIRLLLAETAVLTGAGSGAGVVLASWATRLLVSRLSNARAPISLDAGLDHRVLAFAVSAAAATALLFGTVPALRAAAVAPIDAVKTRERSAHADGRVLSAVIVSEVALSLLLVIAAGLFVQTFERLARVPLGFDAGRTLVVTVTASTVPASERPALVNRVAHAVAAVPGVQAVGGALNPPIIGGLGGADLVLGAPGSLPPPDAPRVSHVDRITPGWFGGYGIPIVAGRDFDDRDVAAGAPGVVIVNDAFVQRFFPRTNVIGMSFAMAWRIALGDFPFGTRRIVGVAGDSVYHSIRDQVQPMIFLPLQAGEPLLQKDFYLGVQTAAGNPASLQRAVASAITATSADVAFSFDTLTQELDDALTDNRLLGSLSTFFGGVALALAAVGLYGVTSYAVSQRRAEIGVRLALGAAPGGVIRLVMSRVAALVGAGLGIGIVASTWASTFVASLLYGVKPRDPVTFVGATFVLAAVGAVAGWLPAWRASRIDPAEVLRAD